MLSAAARVNTSESDFPKSIFLSFSPQRRTPAHSGRAGRDVELHKAEVSMRDAWRWDEYEDPPRVSLWDSYGEHLKTHSRLSLKHR